MNDVFASPHHEQQNEAQAPADPWAGEVTAREDRQNTEGLEPRPERMLARRQAALAVAGFALALGVLVGMPAGPLGAAAPATVASR